MSNKGFYISKLHVTGNNVQTAKIKFESGFNVVSGLSDTGKSYIFSCINFALGSGKYPKTTIPESKGYDTVYLEIKTYKGETFTIQRNIFNGKIKVKEVEINYFLTRGEAQSLLQQHSKINDKNISTFLLDLCGLSKSLLRINKQNLTRELSYRDLANLSLIDEERIITEDSPVYNGQYTNRTVEQAIFKLLLTGKDDSGLEEIEETKVYKSRIKGKLELIENYIDQSLIKLDAYENEADKGNKSDIESRLEELNILLTDSSKQIAKLTNHKATLFNKVTELKSNLILKNELLARFVLLLEHYDSDINRLNFITQGDNYFSQLKASNCPICDGDLDQDHYDCLNEESEQSSSIMQSINMELQKIIKKKGELIKTIDKERVDTQALEDSINKLNIELQNVQEDIQSKLKPIQESSAKKVESLMAKLSNIQEIKTLNSQLTNYYSERSRLIDLQENKPTIAEYEGKVSYSVLKAFCDSIKSILEVWEFGQILALNFDTNYANYDIVIDRKNRNAFGKGYRSILYSAFVLSLLKYTVDRDLPTTGHLVIDSPLTTFQGKESKLEAVDEDKIPQDIEKSFFKDLAELNNELQVIILDNKDPDYEIIEKINYVHFTKGKSEGRYGFFPV
ncbi:AAA family ATPase [Aquimarina sp. Aq107]|uniref:AAA family ATPase n=1 Tax=Aquimarina sp. Aq107 TaxID=1191912 RepID=UPI000D553D10|nr:AAA family ATPase [Aquimarina sp. Aq107]